jgi:hypothetical protein
VAPAFAVDPSWPPHLARIRTRLDRFTLEERCRLVNWGYLVADVALRSHVVSARAPSSLPFPKLGFLFPAAVGPPAEAAAFERVPEPAGPISR